MGEYEKLYEEFDTVFVQTDSPTVVQNDRRKYIIGTAGVLLILIVVGVLFFTRKGGDEGVQEGETLPADYLVYSETEDAYKENANVKDARRWERERTREGGCADFAYVKRTYGWYVYCP
jgi:hypothetical protein